MNPVFIILVVLIAAALWVSLAWLFPKLGRDVKDIWEDVKYSMEDNYDDEGDEK